MDLVVNSTRYSTAYSFNKKGAPLSYTLSDDIYTTSKDTVFLLLY